MESAQKNNSSRGSALRKLSSELQGRSLKWLMRDNLGRDEIAEIMARLDRLRAEV